MAGTRRNGKRRRVFARCPLRDASFVRLALLFTFEIITYNIGKEKVPISFFAAALKISPTSLSFPASRAQVSDIVDVRDLRTRTHATMFASSQTISQTTRFHKPNKNKQRKMSTKINGFMTLRSEPDAPARSVTSDDVSSWPEIERMLVKACSIYAGDSSVNGRMQAAGQLGPHTTHDAVSEMSVVEVFTTAYEGSLEDCSTILDVHYRLLGTSFLRLRL